MVKIGTLKHYVELQDFYQLNTFDFFYYSGGKQEYGPPDIKWLPQYDVFVMKLYKNKPPTYRAFCAGSIITEQRVLSSAHCFYTNRKRPRHNFANINLVGGLLHTVETKPDSHEVMQWRAIKHIYTQKFFRFPAYGLAVVEVKEPWLFNIYIGKIPYASKDFDYDGVCVATTVKATQSWATNKHLFSERFQVIPRRLCEKQLLKSCRIYLCTDESTRMTLATSETEGGGLICHATGDPQEVDKSQGVLVGVTALINIGIPTLHLRVGMFHKWITDGCLQLTMDMTTTILCVVYSLNKSF